MASIYNDALLEQENPIEDCKNPSVILYKYSVMSPQERKNYHAAIIESANAREKVVAKKAAARNKVQDYSQSFGGTAADTKNEKEAAAILRGEGGTANEEEDNSYLYPLLSKPYIEHSYDQQQLRKYGAWGKVMGGTGCFLYLHYLTKEVVSLRPEEYEEEVADSAGGAGAVEAVRDPANGLPRIDLADLQLEVERIVSEGKKTPLIIDNSKSGAVRAFYTYKGLLEVSAHSLFCLTSS